MSKSPTTVQVIINDRAVAVDSHMTVATALAYAGVVTIRRSRTGEARAALCGMGICHECRATINGLLHQRTCQIPCESGMRINTDA